MIKKYSTAQHILYTEESRFSPTLQGLVDRGYAGLIEEAMLKAWNGRPEPIPLNGYFYADVDPGEIKGQRAGLIAYPAKVGIDGDKVWLILLDPERFTDPSGRGGFARLYRAPAKELLLPFSRWPSDTELRNGWQELKLRAPFRQR